MLTLHLFKCVHVSSSSQPPPPVPVFGCVQTESGAKTKCYRVVRRLCRRGRQVVTSVSRQLEDVTGSTGAAKNLNWSRHVSPQLSAFLASYEKPTLTLRGNGESCNFAARQI